MAVAGLVVGGLVVPAQAAKADSTVVIPPGNTTVVTNETVTGLLLDESHDHVFLATQSGTVDVRDLAGAEVTTIAEAGARNLALSADGATLYVTLSNSSAIAAIDTTTLAEQRRWSTGAGTCPTTLAVTGSKVWFGDGCSQAHKLKVLDTSVDPAVVSAVDAPGVQDTPALAAAPADGSPLYEADDGNLRVLSTSTTAGTVLRQRTVAGGGELHLNTDGSHVLMRTVDQDEVQSFRTSDLSADGVWSQAGSGGFAVSAQGVVAGTDTGHLRAFLPDGTQTHDYALSTPYGSYLASGNAMQFNAAGDTLYAATSGSDLRILRDPGRLAVGIAVTGPAAPTRNVAFTVTGRVVSDTPVAGGTSLDVVRQGPHDSTDLTPIATADDGSFSFQDTVPDRGRYTYVVVYGGDDVHARAAGRGAVNVKGVVNAASILTHIGPWKYGSTITIVGHVPSGGGKAQLFVTDPYANGETGDRHLVKAGTVDASGSFRVPLRVTKRINLEFVFAGNDEDEPMDARQSIQVSDAVSGHMVGGYATSGAYRLFHASRPLDYGFSWTPENVGSDLVTGCGVVFVQELVGGVWHTKASNGCYEDDPDVVTYLGPRPVGAHFRFRLLINGTKQNVGTYSTYSYAKITK